MTCTMLTSGVKYVLGRWSRGCLDNIDAIFSQSFEPNSYTACASMRRSTVVNASAVGLALLWEAILVFWRSRIYRNLLFWIAVPVTLRWLWQPAGEQTKQGSSRVEPRLSHRRQSPPFRPQIAADRPQLRPASNPIWETRPDAPALPIL